MISTLKLHESDPAIADIIRKETRRKEFSLELIPSENCVSEAVLEATGSILTDKYCEGYPGKRYYGGCQHYDELESICIDRAKQMFGAQEANVQPHSGANANMAVQLNFLQPGDTILGHKLDHGGHLTHGHPANISGKFFNATFYGVNPESGLIEESEVRKQAEIHRPKMIVCGASAYSRQIDFAMFRRVADEVGAILLADVAHYAGLIVGGVYDNPEPHVDIITTTTHKTLRGPRGGLILCKSEHIKGINRSVFPGIQGGPLMHQIAGKAVAFKEALSEDFRLYASKVVTNARALSEALMECGFKILSGGTDSHVMLVDLRGSELTGAEVEECLGKVGITVNKNTVPGDPKPATVTSGFRIGTPAITSRGFRTSEMQLIAQFIRDAVDHRHNDKMLVSIHEQVAELCKRFPLFPHRLS